jgi:hypothetical protein
MPIHKSAMGAIVISLAIAATGAFAQTMAPAGKPSVAATTTEKVEDWTVKQWNAATAEWANHKSEWASCQKQVSDKKLSGRASWSFLYDCMKS